MTKSECHRAIKWFQERFKIQDWEVELHLLQNQPDWAEASQYEIGVCEPTLLQKKARIWVSNKKAEEFDEDVLEVLFHELVHMICCDIEITNDTGDRQEMFWNQIATLAALQYRREKRNG